MSMMQPTDLPDPTGPMINLCRLSESRKRWTVGTCWVEYVAKISRLRNIRQG